jgi:hypothetical protein
MKNSPIYLGIILTLILNGCSINTTGIEEEENVVDDNIIKVGWGISANGNVEGDLVNVEVRTLSFPEQIPELVVNGITQINLDIDFLYDSDIEYNLGYFSPNDTIDYAMHYKNDTLNGKFVIPAKPLNFTCNGVLVEDTAQQGYSYNIVYLPDTTREITFDWDQAEGFTSTRMTIVFDYRDTSGVTKTLRYIYRHETNVTSYTVTLPDDFVSFGHNSTFIISHSLTEPIESNDYAHVLSELQYVYYSVAGPEWNAKVNFTDD